MLETNNVPMMMTMNNTAHSLMEIDDDMTMSYKAHNIGSNLNIRQGWHYPNETIESTKERPYMLLYYFNDREKV